MSPAPPPGVPEVLPLRRQAEIRDDSLLERLDAVVPEMMDREDIDAWVVIAREYNEDPVAVTMLPATWLSARRRTILVFLGRGRTRMAVARYPVGDAFPPAWDPAAEPDQWNRLAALLDDADPGRIAVNASPTFALADGLSHTEFEAFVTALPERLRTRVVGGADLAIGWLETRTPGEMAWYRRVCALSHSILREGLSNAAVTPGETSTGDLEWWFRQRVADLGLDTWFHPTASVQRRSHDRADASFADRPTDTLIRRGDLVHVDFGIVYLGLHTDMQQHAYVLRPGEREAPDGLVAALRTGNRLQDVLIAEFVAGRTGNDVLAAARAAAIAEGIRPTIYTHPLGVHGHAAGPTIGLWDQQEGVPGAGDYPLHPDTVYAIELNATVDVPEWDGQSVSIMLEEDAFFDGESVTFLDGRQTDLWIVA